MAVADENGVLPRGDLVLRWGGEQSAPWSAIWASMASMACCMSRVWICTAKFAAFHIVGVVGIPYSARLSDHDDGLRWRAG
jgi:hypothetical protein